MAMGLMSETEKQLLTKLSISLKDERWRINVTDAGAYVQRSDEQETEYMNRYPNTSLPGDILVFVTLKLLLYQLECDYDFTFYVNGSKVSSRQWNPKHPKSGDTIFQKINDLLEPALTPTTLQNIGGVYHDLTAIDNNVQTLERRR